MIYHICEGSKWHEAQHQGEYRAASLETEGFIHASTESQVVKTANRFYRGQQGLVLLEIEEAMLTSDVRYEAADGDLFPHLYGPINLDAVTAAFPFPPDAEGAFSLPERTDESENPGKPAMSTLIERLSERARDPKRATDEAPATPRGGKPTAAPATEAQIVAAETALGFQLPLLLRRIYQEIGNGGFGPGGGLSGVPLGPDDVAASVVGRYAALRRENRAWPVGMIPLCAWGSGIESYADCSQTDTPIIRLDPNMPLADVAVRVPPMRRYPQAASVGKPCWVENPSLASWLEAWADGRPVFYLAYSGPDQGTDGEDEEDGEEEEDSEGDDA